MSRVRFCSKEASTIDVVIRIKTLHESGFD